MQLTRARCYCNAIQSRVTTRLVVWLHNPICQAIGHRWAGGDSCNPYGLLPLPRAPRCCGKGRKPGSRNSVDFQGRDSASDPKDDPDVALVGYARDYAIYKVANKLFASMKRAGAETEPYLL